MLQEVKGSSQSHTFLNMEKMFKLVKPKLQIPRPQFLISADNQVFRVAVTGKAGGSGGLFVVG